MAVLRQAQDERVFTNMPFVANLSNHAFRVDMIHYAETMSRKATRSLIVTAP